MIICSFNKKLSTSINLKVFHSLSLEKQKQFFLQNTRTNFAFLCGSPDINAMLLLMYESCMYDCDYAMKLLCLQVLANLLPAIPVTKIPVMGEGEQSVLYV